MDPANPLGEAIAIIGDRIIGVGADKDFETLAGPGTEIFDAGGKTVLPGFNDNHSHPLSSAQSLANVDVSGTKSHAEFFARIRKRAEETPAGQWILAYGYDEGLFAEKREPNLEELDAAVPAHPLYATRACQHVGLANSLVMKAIGYTADTPDPQGGEIVRENGKLTGRLCDAASFAIRAIIPKITVEQNAKYMKEMSGIYNSYGITSTTEMGLLDGWDDELRVWDEILKKNYLTVRIAAYCFEDNYRKFMNTGVPLPIGNELFRFQGRKILLDGGGGSGTAKMSEPNLHDGKTGILYYTQEELDAIVWEAHSHGQQIATHGIGDVAIRMILDAYEKAQTRLPRPDARHRLEHCSFCFPPLVERVIRQRVLPHMHTGFLYYFGETHKRNYGEERLAMEFPYRSLLDGGLIIANGSDSPVHSPNPACIMYGAIARKTERGMSCGEKERITAKEAVYSYTAAGAYFTFDEGRKGTLSPGKLADIVVTNLDPTTVDAEPERILEMRAERTILGGKTVFER
jgi:predicted amidohydrolase YtcJ